MFVFTSIFLSLYLCFFFYIFVVSLCIFFSSLYFTAYTAVPNILIAGYYR